MAVSLEARVPLLDLDAVRFAAAIPVERRTGPGRPKHLLRCLLARRVGPKLADRKKHGFRVPKERWLGSVDRGELGRRLDADGIEAWLDRDRLRAA